VSVRNVCSIRLLLAAAALPLTTAAAAEPQVVASIRPIHSLVAGVMQGVGEPALLLSGATSPHDYSLRPSDARALENADVVFWVGDGLEAFLAKPLDALAGDARIVALSNAEGVALLPTRAGGIWEEGAHGEHEDADEAHAEEHEHGGHDMHLWLDPRNAAAMVDAIVATLAAVDPADGARYQANGRELRQRLAVLDEALSEQLAPVADRPFVVFHDAYRYFVRRYGLDEVGAITIDPQRRPGAQRLTEIRARLQELGAACVFAEPQFEPALVDTVIEGSAARKGVLDPLGATLAAGPDQYFELLDGLAGALVACLEGRSN
jgi:zinc transport system substrate-binding protein